MSPSPANFELERFALTPVTDDTVLLEVGGVLTDVPPRSAPPRLLVEGTRRSRREHDALEAEADGKRLRASFVVPAADAETAGFALAVGGVLLELPAPDPTPGADRTVALARELNGARRELARLRSRVEADAEVAAGHAAELAAVQEAAAAREREVVEAADADADAAEEAADARAAAAEQAATARAATAEQDAAGRIAAIEADADGRIEVAEQRATELEVASSRLETVLADVRLSAEQRDIAAAEARRELESELEVSRREALDARLAAAEATSRAEEGATLGARLRSELELAQRALDGRDAELARSPDRRARAVARPRTVAGVTGEHPVVEPDAPEPERDDEPPIVTPPAEPAADAAPSEAEIPTEATVADPASDDGPMDPDPVEDDWLAGTLEHSAVPAEEASVPTDQDAAAVDAGEGDPVPDDGEADQTVTHDAVPDPRPDPDPPEDTGPIPLRRGSQRRYVERSDRDAELGGDAVRVLGRERPRASSLPPAPEADAGPPALPFGLTQRTAVIAAFALAAFLVLLAVLGYVF